jgi:hypothetical protein
MEEKIKKEVKPRTAKPATSPITVPPKETFKACGKLVRAACSSYICFVAIFIHIPMPKPRKRHRKQKYY